MSRRRPEASAKPFDITVWHQLLYKALVALDHATERATADPSDPGPPVGFCLAYIFACSKKRDRQPYDDFWRTMIEEDRTSWSDEHKSYRRRTMLTGSLHAIIRDLGLPRSPAVLHMLRQGHQGKQGLSSKLAHRFWNEVAEHNMRR